jgi:hypothetical protein
MLKLTSMQTVKQATRTERIRDKTKKVNKGPGLLNIMRARKTPQNRAEEARKDKKDHGLPGESWLKNFYERRSAVIRNLPKNLYE